MSEFKQWEKYVFDEKDPRRQNSRHTFFKVSDKEIAEAEERIGRKFPNELKEFYKQIGYGFMCREDRTMFDRLLDPDTVASFRLCEDIYEGDPTCADYDDEDKLVFFEVDEETFITMDLTSTNANGQSPVYYFEQKISDSLEEFLYKMDEKTDYYLYLHDD